MSRCNAVNKTAAVRGCLELGATRCSMVSGTMVGSVEGRECGLCVC